MSAAKAGVRAAPASFWQHPERMYSSALQSVPGLLQPDTDWTYPKKREAQDPAAWSIGARRF
eukprot:1059069-Amphidinium_carterae.1